MLKSLLFLLALLVSLSICSNSYGNDSYILPTIPTKGIWLWAGHSADEVKSNTTLYLHQATLERGIGSPKLKRQGLGTINIPNCELVIVYRLEQLLDPQALALQLQSDVWLWRQRGNEVVGVQIDFDSPTKALDRYITFLVAVRHFLPNNLRLSVTGLADWASSASDNNLKDLFAVADEVVFQLYNGRAAIRNLNLYADKLSQLQHPFMVGLLPGELSLLPSGLKGAKNLKGIVYFGKMP